MAQTKQAARPRQTAGHPLGAARAVAQRVLDGYAAGAIRPEPGRAGDLGPALLATLVAAGDATPAELTATSPASRALVTWLRQLPEPVSTGLLGSGAAGRMLALRFAAGTWPRLARLAQVTRLRLGARAAAASWAVKDVGWRDYDLVTGPAGTLLALAADPAASAADRAPLVAHLARLCASDDLTGLRVGQYRGEKLRGWNFGQINLGLAHGLPGVAIALCAAGEADGLTRPAELLLHRLARRLTAEAYTDPRGVITWRPGSGGSGPVTSASPRQAWCYGCPGVAWALWEAGRVTGDEGLRAFAATAIGSLIAAWDDHFYLDGLDVCHGAAGVMLVLDSFSRNAGLPGAAGLRDHLAQYLAGQLAAAEALAAENNSLQSGASGVLAALLTVDGADRRWLAALGLR